MKDGFGISFALLGYIAVFTLIGFFISLPLALIFGIGLFYLFFKVFRES